MPNNMYAKPVQSKARPMDFSMYMSAQEAGFKANQTALNMKQKRLERDATNLQAGGAAMENVLTSLNTMSAYGNEDEARLAQIKAGYTERLQGIIKEGIEGGGLHTVANPLRLESQRLKDEVQSGDLRAINTRYGKAMEKDKAIDEMYSKGDLADYDYMFYKADLTHPVKPTVDVLDDAMDFVKASGLTGKGPAQIYNSLNEIIASRNPDVLQRMAAFDVKSGDPKNGYRAALDASVREAALLAYKQGPANGNFSTGGSIPGPNANYIATQAGINTGVTPTADNGYMFGWVGGDTDKKFMEIGNNILADEYKGKDVSGTKDILEQADLKAQNAHLYINPIAAKDIGKVTDFVKATMSMGGVKSLTHDNTQDSNELVAALHDKEQYTDLKVLGTYTHNQYYPAGYSMTATNVKTGEQETFVVGNTSTNIGPYEHIKHDAYQSFYTTQDRREGKVSEFPITMNREDSPEGAEFVIKSRPAIINQNGGPTWVILADIVNKTTGKTLKISDGDDPTTIDYVTAFLQNKY